MGSLCSELLTNQVIYSSSLLWRKVSERSSDCHCELWSEEFKIYEGNRNKIHFCSKVIVNSVYFFWSCFLFQHTCIFVYKWQVWPDQHWLNRTHRLTQYFHDWGLLEEKKYLFLLHLPFPARNEASSDKNLLCKHLSVLFPSGKPRESPKKACSQKHPTWFQWASEVWRDEWRSLLAN